MIPRMTDIATVLEAVIQQAAALHTAGTFGPAALAALARHAGERPVTHSVETGSGASTLLFSHLSTHHTVFAIDGGTGSIRQIEHSPLLRPGVVTFVEGPTQLTLPAHRFDAPLQLALIDGPHAYPFPDLEYYYLYPHLESGALLVLDDIHIPTLANLFDFLRADDMFILEEVVDTTAFFRRTGAVTFPPTGDGWETQGYNRRLFEALDARPIAEPRYVRLEGAPAWYLDAAAGSVNPPLDRPLSIAAGQPFEASGWALDPAGRQPAAAIDLAVAGEVWRAPVSGLRPDVAAAHHDQAYLRSGFHARLPAGALQPGAGTLEFRIVLDEGRSYQVGGRLELRVE
jgi:hypothetical protein